MSSPDQFQFECAGQSDTGRVRSHNEDSFLSLPTQGLWVVADGMGGHSAGDVASNLITAEMRSLGVAVCAQDQRARARERIDRAHFRILDHARDTGQNMVGSTIVTPLIHGAEMTCIWAGDSRIYLLREGRLTRLTQDHSEVANMVSVGLISEAEARRSPQRNIITRAIGIGDQAMPDTASGAVRSGDMFLLCSDGLTEHLDDDDIALALSAPGPVAPIVQGLIARTLERGAKDNVTAVVVRCHALPEPEGEEA